MLLTGKGTDFFRPTTRLYKNFTETENLPIVNNPVEDQIYNIGFGSSAINLSDIFLDNIGNGFSYVTRIYDTRVITADYDDNNLILIEANQAGETNVIITAKDENGSVVSDEFSVKVNTLPDVNDAIQDQIYTQGFISFAIDVSNRYSDPDGDELAISISVVDESIVNATYSDNVLTIIEGDEVGETIITLIVDDGNTGLVFDEFAVVVEKPLLVNSNSFKVYPNPSSENFTLVTGNSFYSDVSIKSIDGKELDYSVIKKNGEIHIKFHEDYKGILFLKVEIDNKIHITKLIKY